MLLDEQQANLPELIEANFAIIDLTLSSTLNNIIKKDIVTHNLLQLTYINELS